MVYHCSQPEMVFRRYHHHQSQTVHQHQYVFLTTPSFPAHLYSLSPQSTPRLFLDLGLIPQRVQHSLCFPFRLAMFVLQRQRFPFLCALDSCPLLHHLHLYLHVHLHFYRLYPRHHYLLADQIPLFPFLQFFRFYVALLMLQLLLLLLTLLFVCSPQTYRRQHHYCPQTESYLQQYPVAKKYLSLLLLSLSVRMAVLHRIVRQMSMVSYRPQMDRHPHCRCHCHCHQINFHFSLAL
mmetsp:Transcript_26322/g.43033  ORF Transcript_26322/g.43033 Transcript_26322/m.43033 type:complete len:236 (+) Transcript_26322:232-939(+)